MLRIGLTGGIASGKTTVRRVFERAGIPMLDADALTHEFFAPGGELVEEVAGHFGSEVVDRKGGHRPEEPRARASSRTRRSASG